MHCRLKVSLTAEKDNKYAFVECNGSGVNLGYVFSLYIAPVHSAV